MDHQRFDAAVRALGRQVTRRRGLAAAAGVLLAASGHAAEARRKHDRTTARGQRKREPGPCGDGSPEANACVRGKSCCTRYCIDGLCRCKPNYMICQRASQCCSGRCVNGRCDGGCGRGRVPCEENFNCCDGFACIRNICKRSRTGSCDSSNCSGCCAGSVCRSGTEPDSCGAGKGICAICKANEVCQGGACVPAPDSCRATCAGCCAFNACYPGDSDGSCGRNGAFCTVCGGSTPNCVNGSCTGCASDGDCPPATPYCSAAACVACRTAGDCPASANACTGGQCRCGGGAACSGAAPVCSAGTCVQCAANTDCPGTAPVCSAGTCVGCTTNGDCSRATPLCCSGACTAPAWRNQTVFGNFGVEPGELDSPESVAVTADLLTLYVADRKNHRVAIWTRANTSTTTWTNPGFIGSGPGSGATEFNAPYGVALSASGTTLFVSDRGNNRVSVWTRSGAVWSHSLNFATAAGNLSQPQGIAVNAAGSIAWIADAGNNRIVVWSNAGGPWAQQGVFGGAADFDGPYGVAAAGDDQTALVAQLALNAGASEPRVSMWEEAGGSWGEEAAFGPLGSAAAELTRPRGIAVSADGLTAWVADTGNNRIAVWTRANSNATTWTSKAVFGKFGVDPDRFSGPSGIALSSDGVTAWIADTGNNRVSVWAQGCPA
ncbi:MAG: NHL repeat-containing protein [Chloroflexota bacterium]